MEPEGTLPRSQELSTCTCPIAGIITNYLCGAEYHSRGDKLCSHSVVTQHFMEPEGSLPSSQDLSTCTCPIAGITSYMCSAVGKGSGYELDHKARSSSPGIACNIHFCVSPRRRVGHIDPSIQWISGVLSLGVKRPRSESDHSFPTNAEVKKTWLYTPLWHNA
jgi:hypothetical protein